jgi:hypothetical protein
MPGSCSSDQLIQVRWQSTWGRLQTESSEGNFAALFFFVFCFLFLQRATSAFAFDELW